MHGGLWKVRLTKVAQRDYEEILNWTLDHFGVNQVNLYDATLLMALGDLRAGPDLPSVKNRDDIGVGVCTLHVARKGRKGRHFLMFRVSKDDGALDVLRILHDRMDLARHLAVDDMH